MVPSVKWREKEWGVPIILNFPCLSYMNVVTAKRAHFPIIKLPCSVSRTLFQCTHFPAFQNNSSHSTFLEVPKRIFQPAFSIIISKSWFQLINFFCHCLNLSLGIPNHVKHTNIKYCNSYSKDVSEGIIFTHFSIKSTEFFFRTW